MQTFLPYASYTQSAMCLDYKRLGKQRVECLQILNSLLGVNPTKNGWKNHPAIKMWKGCETELIKYTKEIINEWTTRGYNDSCLQKVKDLEITYSNKLGTDIPLFLENEQFHTSHKSNLLRKDKEFYSRYGWTCSSDLPYIWIITNE